jgi:hypothetical protein
MPNCAHTNVTVKVIGVLDDVYSLNLETGELGEMSDYAREGEASCDDCNEAVVFEWSEWKEEEVPEWAWGMISKVKASRGED